MVSAGSYLIGALQLALVIAPIAWSAYRIRRATLPTWTGAPARLVESITAVALLTWLMEILGVVGLLYAGTLIVASLITAAVVTLLPGGGADDGPSRRAGGTSSATGPAGPLRTGPSTQRRM